MSTKVIDLGWCIAKLDVHNKKLTIVSPSDSSENNYMPAESVAVYGEAGLIALRDVLNEAFPEESK